MGRCILAQFYVQYVGIAAIRYHPHPQEPARDTARSLVIKARKAFKSYWPGTEKDMQCIGVTDGKVTLNKFGKPINVVNPYDPMFDGRVTGIERTT